MIKFITGDIFKVEAEAIVNTVNCVGIMGRGLALQFKIRYPENYNEYYDACKKNKVQPGKMFLHETGKLVYPKYIINFPTKRHWRGKSRIQDIEEGLKDLIKIIQKKKITSIAIPPLGSGLGGLDWSEVKTVINKQLECLKEIEIMVFEPHNPDTIEKKVKNKDIPNMTPGRAALIELIHRYLGGLLDPFVTLLEIHKLMYFLQESGEDLKLNYKAGPYGPYAENLRHVLQRIEGHYISGYEDGGDNPAKRLSLVPGAYNEASEFLKNHNETKNRFDRVSELVDGFESSYGLELLSTVHWVKKTNSLNTLDSIIKKTYMWNERKKQFTPRQIELALNILKQKKW